MAVAYKERNNNRWAVKVGDRVYREGITRYQATQILWDLQSAVNNVKLVYHKGG